MFNGVAFFFVVLIFGFLMSLIIYFIFGVFLEDLIFQYISGISAKDFSIMLGYSLSAGIAYSNNMKEIKKLFNIKDN